jgi:ADP-ribosylglycohydrolase
LHFQTLEEEEEQEEKEKEKKEEEENHRHRHRHSSFSFFASGFFAQESFPSSICSLCARGFSQGFQGPVSCCFVLRKKGK